MKKLLWLTDIHLDGYRGDKITRLYRNIKKANPDLMVIGGDISRADEIIKDLSKLEKKFSFPVYFVLGNHDYESDLRFHKISISELRNEIIEFSKKSKNVKWLPNKNIVKITHNTCLIGHDGWPDGRYENYNKGNNIFQNSAIFDFSNLTKKEIHFKMKQLADESAEYIDKMLSVAVNEYSHIFLLTHVPPFIESCWYKPRGKYAAPEAIPFFTNKALGDVLLKHMKKNKDKHLTVLCGHTHGYGVSMIQSNLITFTGELVSRSKGKYIGPKIQHVFNVV